MIQITPHMRILVALEPVDLRAGIDGLVAVEKYADALVQRRVMERNSAARR